MKTLLIIHAHAGIDDLIARHSSTWVTADPHGFLGIGRVGETIAWPEWIPSFDIGRQSHVDGPNLPERLIETLRYVTVTPRYQKYNDFVLTEADSIFFGPLRERSGDFETVAFANADPRFNAPHYFHPYWRFSRRLAKKVVRLGTAMLTAGEIEHGFPDRFLGQLFHKHGLPFTDGPIYSCNAFDEPRLVDACRQQVSSGQVIFAHGVKTFEQFVKLTA